MSDLFLYKDCIPTRDLRKYLTLDPFLASNNFKCKYFLEVKIASLLSSLESLQESTEPNTQPLATMNPSKKSQKSDNFRYLNTK